MNVSFSCPKCDKSVRRELAPNTEVLDCPYCTQRIALPTGAIRAETVDRCLVCPSRDLYVRKDMPQRLGVSIVAIGILASSIAWGYHQLYWTFGILFATALADLVLFFVVGNSLMCYRCHAVYRGVDPMAVHGPFNLETHEKHRQMAARLSQSSAQQSNRPV